MHENSVKYLNESVADELSAVHQYMYFHFHCDDQGFDLLANLFKRTAIEEMQHVELLADRILFLGGDVEMAADKEVDKIHDVDKMLKKAAEMEESSVKSYNKFARLCYEDDDNNTRKLFEQLIDDEERHFDQYDNEIDALKRFGDKYLALQSIERSRNVAGGE